MKVSGFTFLRNAHELGFPFVESIRSALPLVDEFIVNVGVSNDSTLEMIQAIDDPKIKIITSKWNENICSKGFVYAQQKMIAQYSCTGDWAFYLEADEVIHEKDYANIRAALEKYYQDDKVEALVFDYIHFYGNTRTYVWSPAWYRRAARIIKTSVRNFAPDGLFWVVIDKKNRKGRYPYAAKVDAQIYHYGWARDQQQMQNKFSQVQRYWTKVSETPAVEYAAIDPQTLHEFTGTHPRVVADYFKQAEGIFVADKTHTLTKRERKNRLGLKLEKLFGLDLSKKHYQLIDKS